MNVSALKVLVVYLEVEMDTGLYYVLVSVQAVLQLGLFSPEKKSNYYRKDMIFMDIFRYCLASPIGNGTQWFVGSLRHLKEKSMMGWALKL